MTDLIERLGPGWGGTDELDAAVVEPDLSREFDVARFPVTAVFLAIVAGCSAALLVVAASAHLGRGFEIALLIVAAGQIVGSVLALVRPVRTGRYYQLAVNAAALGLWAVIGTGRAGVGGTIVGTGLALAGGGVVTALVLAVRRQSVARWSSASVVFCSMLPLALILATGAAVLTLPKAHVAAAASGSKAAKLSLAARETANALSTAAKVPGENSPNFQRVAIGNATEAAGLTPYQPLSPSDQALLTQQLTESYHAAMEFPTVASAKAAGLILAGGMAPGVGAHFQSLGNSSFASFTGSVFDASKPASWIYASTADNAPVVGVMYESLASTPPAGFVGPNDYWHRHTNVCVQFGAGGKIGVPFAADQNVTPQECTDVHGTFMKKTVWMVHAWVVPGWESPEGVFSHANLHVYCPGNTDLTDAIGFCVRQQ